MSHTPTAEPEYWYRYEDKGYANPADEYGESTGAHYVVELHKFSVKKHTPCGVRLSINRVVLHASRKRFACATLEEAKVSFIARKKKQASILRARAAIADRAIELVNRDKIYATHTY